MSTLIQISNLSKTYRLGEIGTGTISRDLERWYKMRIKGQEDPFLKIGDTSDRSKRGISDVVYSLKDINLDVQQGEALGIIGKNGAGKSTLLKIISQVTSPTTGRINIKGRIASLLEVGTGFHPDLTGRENIFLNGAILGMRKHEIKRKFDEIVDFSGVERYIDTPVKRYSSGMYMRLAFAVAAHLESEILIVDEVLAVGDAEFQKKCLGKMGDVSKGEGRTVLFVSHNIQSIKTLCNNCLYLDKGSLFEIGPAEKIIELYKSRITPNFQISSDFRSAKRIERSMGSGGVAGKLLFSLIQFLEQSGKECISFSEGERIYVKIKITIVNPIDSLIFHIRLFDADTYKSIALSKIEIDRDNFNKYNEFHIELQTPLSPGNYLPYIAAYNNKEEPYDIVDKEIFDVPIISITTIGNPESTLIDLKGSVIANS
jgi:lipopolysaccharide transport system ATP-binding protein